jgi:hypothetical protein
MTPDDAVEIFLGSNEANTQLDIFRENGQVMLQVYRYSDVRKWGYGIDFGVDNGYVFELLFNKSKTNNVENYARFQNSELWHEFRTFSDIEQNSFFYFLSINAGQDRFSAFVIKVLNEVYGNPENIDFQVNIY